MHENQCLSCGSNCLKCVDGTNCIICNETYYNNEGICSMCPRSCENCSLVEGQVVCSSCR